MTPEKQKERDHRARDLPRSHVPEDVRPESRRDRDRIIYSSAWRRLAGVTQVVAPLGDVTLLHNRLTHSEKVAQVAASIAENLKAKHVSSPELLTSWGGLDTDVVAAASLAHDLGHAPFGHVGEEVLDRLALEVLNLDDGFEGNAQTFRMVTKIQRRDPRYDGLLLTRASLAAIAKYPWPRASLRDDHEAAVKSDLVYRLRRGKFSVYETEIDDLVDAQTFLPMSNYSQSDSKSPKSPQSLEASIMDVADDITYAVHDLEDFYLAGALDIRRVLSELEDYLPAHSYSTTPSREVTFTGLAARLAKDYPTYFSTEFYAAAIGDVRKFLWDFNQKFDGGLHAEALARYRCSQELGKYITDVAVVSKPDWQGGPPAMLGRPTWHEVQILKEVTKHFVLGGSDLAVVQRGQQEILKRLVLLLKEWADSESDSHRLPPRLLDELQIARGQLSGDIGVGYVPPDRPRRGDPYRCILDYVCSLTDSNCVSLYHALSGIQVGRMNLRSFL